MKNLIFRGDQYIGENCSERWTWTFFRFKGGDLAKKRGWCFWGAVDTRIHSMTKYESKYQQKDQINLYNMLKNTIELPQTNNENLF